MGKGVRGLRNGLRIAECGLNCGIKSVFSTPYPLSSAYCLLLTPDSSLLPFAFCLRAGLEPAPTPHPLFRHLFCRIQTPFCLRISSISSAERMEFLCWLR